MASSAEGGIPDDASSEKLSMFIRLEFSTEQLLFAGSMFSF